MLRRLLGIVLLFALFATGALADTRVALIIANANYPQAPLINPVVDAKLVEPALTALGFDVTLALDVDIEAFDAALTAFETKAKDADVALFYFAGHGFAVSDGLGAQNILMSTSADVTATSDRVLRAGGIALDDVILTVSNSAKVALFFIDACRNDPKVRSAVGAGRALAPITDLGADDVFVALSTRLGSVAADGDAGQGTPFARSLSEVLLEPGLRIDDAFTKVRVAVENATDSQQRPDVLRYDLDVPLILKPMGAAPVQEASTSPVVVPEPQVPVTPAVPQLLRVMNSFEPTTLDPHKATTNEEMRIVGDYLEGLLTVDSRGRAIPGQAKSWDISADGLRYTFKLRDGLSWSDGTPVTADDFEYSFRRLVDPATVAAIPYLLFAIDGAAEIFRETLPPNAPQFGVEAIDDKTLRIRLNAPTPYFLQLLTTTPALPVPRHVVEAVGDNWTEASYIVGNGPYTVVDRAPGGRVRAERSATYYDRQNVSIEEVTYSVEDDLIEAYDKYLAGQFDVLTDAPRFMQQQILAEVPGESRFTPFAGIQFYALNMARAPFDNIDVRKALSISIDRESIGPRIWETGEPAAYGWVPPGVANYDGVTPYKPEWASRPHAENVAEARSLMEKAGYSASRPLRFTLRINGSPAHEQLATAVIEMWKAIHVEASLETNEVPVHYDMLASGDFDVGRAGSFLEYSDPSAMLDLLESEAPNNYGQYSNARYDQLVAAARTEFDLVERARMLGEAEKIAMDEFAAIPLVYYLSASIVKPNVRGYEDNPFDLHRTRWIRLE